MSPRELEEALRAVPYLNTLGMRVEELGTNRVVLRLPAAPAVHAHGGAVHASAIYAIGEAAASVAVAIPV